MKYLCGMKLGATNQARMAKCSFRDFVDAPLNLPKVGLIYAYPTNVVIRVLIVVLCFVKKYQFHTHFSETNAQVNSRSVVGQPHDKPHLSCDVTKVRPHH